jgi:hypothetical protein
MGRAQNRKLREPVPYLDWLVEGIGLEDSDYRILLGHLFERRYYWSVPNDDNREADGYALRNEWEGPTWGIPFHCTVLEVLIAMANRASFQMQGFEERNSPQFWFLVMLRNLELADFTDENWYGSKMCGNSHSLSRKFHETIDIFLDRKYTKVGQKNAWFVRGTKRDLRRVEMWYQMMEYFEENYPD